MTYVPLENLKCCPSCHYGFLGPDCDVCSGRKTTETERVEMKPADINDCLICGRKIKITNSRYVSRFCSWQCTRVYKFEKSVTINRAGE